jgi:septal ring factor EnvC (AmiA/AmiB activator)
MPSKLEQALTADELAAFFAEISAKHAAPTLRDIIALAEARHGVALSNQSATTARDRYQKHLQALERARRFAELLQPGQALAAEESAAALHTAASYDLATLLQDHIETMLACDSPDMKDIEALARTLKNLRSEARAERKVLRDQAAAVAREQSSGAISAEEAAKKFRELLNRI